ncbi:folate-binding protein [Lysobacteraceae bacterium NML75-0749]|nr:folate-binding protein [Xanthomonadaceae bacterium NML75-0749]PJK03134.1 folate-binding protein [Xanthomonadaceae bacterium NML91-0268]
MTDKPHHTAKAFFTLPDYRLLALTGADAVQFAQSQFMNDVSMLADGQYQWNGWLNAKGRLIALFALLRLDAQTLWLLLPDAAPEMLAAELGRYVFRSKVKLTPRTDLHVAGKFEETASESVQISDNVVLLPWPGARKIAISAQASPPDEAAYATWRAADLEAGIPRLDPQQMPKWTPQQLSLQRLAAYSVKKGCYPGQEIVARTHFLGQAKRGLRLLRTSTPAASGDTLIQAERSVGEIVSTAGTLALAVLPDDAQALTLNGQAVELLS